jgi:hypothetical protein
MYCINENIQIKTNLYLFYAAHEMFTKETIFLGVSKMRVRACALRVY